MSFVYDAENLPQPKTRATKREPYKVYYGAVRQAIRCAAQNQDVYDKYELTCLKLLKHAHDGHGDDDPNYWAVRTYFIAHYTFDHLQSKADGLAQLANGKMIRER